MTTHTEQLDAHRRALASVDEHIAAVGRADLPRPSSCAGWTFEDLLAHMVGQNHGFAAAVRDGDAPLEAFAPRPMSDNPLTAWQASCEDVAAAFAAAAPVGRVRLAEVRERPLPLSVVLGFHLVDTVVHGWDVAHSLGRDYRPDDELVSLALAVAEQVPDGPNRLEPGTSFAPALQPVDADPWARTLSLLGRRP